MATSGVRTAERLQKILARAGVCSRREAECYIRLGRVMVNGKVVRELGSRAVWGSDQITVDGVPLSTEVELVTLALHKPRGCVTTMRDPQGRYTVGDIVADLPWRVYPVGRLDYDAAGLLLLSNDGELAYRLQHPRFKVPRTYEVKVKGRPDERALTRLQRGVHLEDGITAAAEVKLLEESQKVSWLTLTLKEGRNHQVKRMCSAVGHPVLRLRRIAVGPIKLGRLRAGTLRRISSRELQSLKRAVGLA
ncbi:MAG: rRNA pseudouridine synthase [Deltaproteobacteria bacterium]|nr:rRNA pseudouridine synthase [Deltaproteobacteria bacterium]